MSEAYIEIMLQSLKKKIQVLDEIIRLNQVQKEVLENEVSDPEDFDRTVESKSDCIDQLTQLDSGFEKLFERVKAEINLNKEQYKKQIREMQGMIRTITDKSMEIQSQEARNKDLMTLKFSRVKQQAKQVRSSQKIANDYYKNMAKINYVEPQFMDNKK